MTKREVELAKALAYAIEILESEDLYHDKDIDYLKDKLAGRKYEVKE